MKDGCKGKVKHKELLTAQIAARKTKNAQVHPYKCSKCKCFHIGRSSSPWLKEKRLDQLFRQIHTADRKRTPQGASHEEGKR